MSVGGFFGIDKEIRRHSTRLETLGSHIEAQPRSSEVFAKQVFVFQQRLVAEKDLRLSQVSLVILMVATDAGEDKVDVGKAASSLLQHDSEGGLQVIR